jgi:hypothetical protein
MEGPPTKLTERLLGLIFELQPGFLTQWFRFLLFNPFSLFYDTDSINSGPSAVRVRDSENLALPFLTVV